MVARMIFLHLLIIVLPDLYIYLKSIRKRCSEHPIRHILWWIPTAIMLLLALFIVFAQNRMANVIDLSNIYLLLLGLIALPKLAFALCSIIGLFISLLLKLKTNYGNYVGFLLSLRVIYIVLYGVFFGAKDLVVKHVELSFDDLPSSFDGYKIAQFSDLHIGNIDPNLLKRLATTINSLNVDAVLFTGDIQNIQPNELDGHTEVLRSIRAKDGVFAILGNHDYCTYMHTSAKEQAIKLQEVIDRERSYGWQLLLNDHSIIRHGNDSIVIAGEENHGSPPFPALGDLNKALKGTDKGSFIVLMQHDPSAWRKHILPQSNAQLTLSGHTHGGQLALFGKHLTSFTYSEDAGKYQDGKQILYVSTGVGGFIPFRFGVPPEVVVITLHSKKTKTL